MLYPPDWVAERDRSYLISVSGAAGRNRAPQDLRGRYKNGEEKPCKSSWRYTPSCVSPTSSYSAHSSAPLRLPQVLDHDCQRRQEEAETRCSRVHFQARAEGRGTSALYAYQEHATLEMDDSRSIAKARVSRDPPPDKPSSCVPCSIPLRSSAALAILLPRRRSLADCEVQDWSHPFSTARVFEHDYVIRRPPVPCRDTSYYGLSPPSDREIPCDNSLPRRYRYDRCAGQRGRRTR